jgi:hypothetical protein
LVSLDAPFSTGKREKKASAKSGERSPRFFKRDIKLMAA